LGEAGGGHECLQVFRIRENVRRPLPECDGKMAA
jgi:hypothetical protein